MPGVAAYIGSFRPLCRSSEQGGDAETRADRIIAVITYEDITVLLLALRGMTELDLCASRDRTMVELGKTVEEVCEGSSLAASIWVVESSSIQHTIVRIALKNGVPYKVCNFRRDIIRFVAF